MFNKLLPLGSVVRLVNGNKRIMICGRLQERLEDRVVFDYCACYYPEGILNPEELFLFNHDKIEEISFQGFADEEEQAFCKFLMDHKAKYPQA